MPHIALSGEPLFHIGNYVVTNTIITTWVVMAILAIVSLFISSNLSRVPGRFQAFMEFVVGGLYSTFEGVLGKQVKKFFPILATFFLFILVSNWFGLLPGVGPALGLKHEAEEAHGEEASTGDSGIVVQTTNDTIAESEEEKYAEGLTPLFRAPTADLNTTIAFALISFVLIQYTGLSALGISYTKKFFNFSGGIPFYVGLLETISEFGKIISFAFRLYGNIFAGEVLITVIAFLIPVVATVPFLGLEIFVGFIQALVFSMLTAVFLSVASMHQEH